MRLVVGHVRHVPLGDDNNREGEQAQAEGSYRNGLVPLQAWDRIIMYIPSYHYGFFYHSMYMSIVKFYLTDNRIFRNAAGTESRET